MWRSIQSRHHLQFKSKFNLYRTTHDSQFTTESLNDTWGGPIGLARNRSESCHSYSWGKSSSESSDRSQIWCSGETFFQWCSSCSCPDWPQLDCSWVSESSHRLERFGAGDWGWFWYHEQRALPDCSSEQLPHRGYLRGASSSGLHQR